MLWEGGEETEIEELGFENLGEIRSEFWSSVVERVDD